MFLGFCDEPEVKSATSGTCVRPKVLVPGSCERPAMSLHILSLSCPSNSCGLCYKGNRGFSQVRWEALHQKHSSSSSIDNLLSREFRAFFMGDRMVLFALYKHCVAFLQSCTSCSFLQLAHLALLLHLALLCPYLRQLQHCITESTYSSTSSWFRFGWYIRDFRAVIFSSIQTSGRDYLADEVGDGNNFLCCNAGVDLSN